MKSSIIKTVLFFTLALGMVSCKKTAANIDPDSLTGTTIDMEYIQDGQTTINSGRQFFGSTALTYPATDVADTATYQVNIAGPNTLSQDLTVTVGQDLNALNDNYSSDSIKYVAMPDSIYHLISTTATIKAGSRVALFKVIFHPSKIDITQNFMLALTATNTQGITTSANFGHIYFHTIGNPIAGVYSWDFTRWNNIDGSGSPAGGTFAGASTKFAPVNPTTITVPTGYYVQPNYTITFKNTGGVLSGFSAYFDAATLASAFTANGISLIDGPHITVSSDYKTITVQYIVFNGSAYRYCIDKYYR